MVRIGIGLLGEKEKWEVGREFSCAAYVDES